MPQIRAELDETRKAVFEATPLVLMTLLDEREDSQGHVSHLLITKTEKAELQDQLLIHVLLDRFVKQLGVSRVAPTSFIDMEEKAYPFSFPM
jgi:hypothetical protein